MRVVVKFFHDEKASGELAVTAQVIHQQEAGGEQADDPIELVAGQQVTFEVGCSENEYPGGGIESCTPAVTDTQIQAVI